MELFCQALDLENADAARKVEPNTLAVAWLQPLHDPRPCSTHTRGKTRPTHSRLVPPVSPKPPSVVSCGSSYLQLAARRVQGSHPN